MISLPPPAGVFKVVKIRKATLRITYDPHVVGAREAMAAYDECSPVLAPEPQDPALTAGAKHIQMLLLRTAASSILTVPVLVMTWAPLPHHPHAYAISSLVLATIVQTAVAGPFYRHAFKSLFLSGLIEMDLLVVLSTTTAYVYSVVAFAYEMLGKPLQGGSFFETSTLLVTLIMFGQLASAFARQRAVAAISLRSLQESSAVVTVDHADGSVTDEIIDARLLQHNDIFRVLPDSTIITDGVVVSGSSTVDESMMTGESLPVEKTSGSEVVAGTRNGSGMLLVRVKRLPGENTISDIANMVDDARFSRAHIQGLVDRVCAWFVPTVLVLGAIVFIIWVLIGIYGKKQSAGDAVVRAVTYAIAVLAISCPCAIGLAVPMVVLIASGVAARLGLIFKAATTIETAREVTHAVFDKTGTLTTGHLEVAHVEILQETVGDGSLKSSSVILALVAVSKHPVARAVAACLIKDGGTTSAQLANIEEIAGKGVQGNLSGRLLQAGNAKWLDLEGHPSVRQVLDAQLTTFCVTYNGTLVAVFGLSDSIRPEVPGLLSMLSKRNIEVSVLSGDHASVVQRVASTLRIPPNRVRASCLPADKAEYIRTLQVGGARVLFCGDGLNDSVALAQADIGVHVAVSAGAGAAASAAADVVLIHTSLDGVAALLGLSDAVHRRIMLNFAWAAVYNTVAILFAAGAFVHARIAPAYAGLGELVSVLPVVLVAMQLKWYAA
ncbi:heavy metal translocating P-type ATPase [Phanerochaete sordida]|uniref:Heavy metal translocating P-type ATPase n=1 Tax=Phanerochaete sordida TaxID=48140 RepID=A0A9P3G5B3_9APHY|nr:heavy metal translocating P-type ATPase [Phanerochaete sordida]